MDEQTTDVQPVAPASATLSIPPPQEVLVGLFSAPMATFDRMAPAKWTLALLPLILFGLLSGVSTLVFMRSVDMGEFVRTQLKQSKFASQMSDAQMEEAIEKSKDANPYTRSAITVVVAPAILLLITLVYWVCFIALGSRLSYTQALLVTAWSQVPKLVALVLASIVYLVKDVNALDPQNPVLSNLGALFGRDVLGPTLYALLSAADVFGFWMMALYVIGFSAIAKIGRGQALLVVLSIFTLKVGLQTAWAFFALQ